MRAVNNRSVVGSFTPSLSLSLSLSQPGQPPCAHGLPLELVRAPFYLRTNFQTSESHAYNHIMVLGIVSFFGLSTKTCCE
jgi:hypothetical protein